MEPEVGDVENGLRRRLFVARGAAAVCRRCRRRATPELETSHVKLTIWDRALPKLDAVA